MKTGLFLQGFLIIAVFNLVLISLNLDALALFLKPFLIPFLLLISH